MLAGKYTVTLINRCSFILPAFSIKLFFVHSILITMVEAMILLWYCAAYSMQLFQALGDGMCCSRKKFIPKIPRGGRGSKRMQFAMVLRVAYPGYQRFFSRAVRIFGVDRRPTHLRPQKTSGTEQCFLPSPSTFELFYRITFTPIRLKVFNRDHVDRHVKKCPKTHIILRKTTSSLKFIALRAIMTGSHRSSPQVMQLQFKLQSILRDLNVKITIRENLTS